MSGSRKLLKLVSIVAAITGLAMLTFGLAVAGCGLFGGTAISGTDAAPLYMGVSGVSALCFIVMGLMGMRASNVPRAAGPPWRARLAASPSPPSRWCSGRGRAL